MPRYVDSLTSSDRLSKSLDTLTEHLKNHKKVVIRNNKELATINKDIDANRVDKIQVLEEKIKKLESETQWVETDQRAAKLTSDDLIKKLDIL